MGGGGTTIASGTDPTLKTSVGLAAWGPNGANVQVPTLLLCGASDTTAPCSMSQGAYTGNPRDHSQDDGQHPGRDPLQLVWSRGCRWRHVRRIRARLSEGLSGRRQAVEAVPAHEAFQRHADHQYPTVDLALVTFGHHALSTVAGPARVRCGAGSRTRHPCLDGVVRSRDLLGECTVIGADGLFDDLTSMRHGLLATRHAAYHRLVGILMRLVCGPAKNEALVANFERVWRTRSFPTFYERPLLILAALRADALQEGKSHPLHAAVAGATPDPDVVTTETVLASLERNRLGVWSTMTSRRVQTNDTTRAIAWLWPAFLAGCDRSLRIARTSQHPAEIEIDAGAVAELSRLLALE